jgi:hypothetical protein
MFYFTVLPKHPKFQVIQILFYTMATTSLKWAARKGAPKTYGDDPMSYDDEGPQRQ